MDENEILWDFLSETLEELHDNGVVSLEECVLVLGIE